MNSDHWHTPPVILTESESEKVKTILDEFIAQEDFKIREVSI